MSRRLGWWLASLAGVAGAAYLARWAADGPVLCLFRRAIDLPCPGCGLTRAFGHLAKGELGAAVALHPLAPLVAGEIVLGWGLLGLVAHGYARVPESSWIERCLVVTGLLLLALWMGRLAIGDLAAVRLQ